MRGGLVGGQDLADAGAIDADGLLGEDVLAGGDGGFEVDGSEAGRRGQDDVVDAAVEHLAVGIQPDEDAVAEIDLVAQFLDLARRP